MHTQTTHFLVSLTVSLLLLHPGAAGATNIQVSPVRLDANGSVHSALLTVTNTSAESVRIQASSYAWEQDPAGSLQLLPTQDVSYFPAMLTLAPGEARHIRVGVVRAPDERERTYRIIVEQLPAVALQSNANPQVMIQMLTRMSIPLFLAPLREQVQGDITNVLLRGRTLTFDVRNSGNVHFLTRSANVRGMDAEGNTVFGQSLSGWYVLAGGERHFSLEIPPDRCPNIRQLEISVETDRGPFTTRTQLPASQCSL